MDGGTATAGPSNGISSHDHNHQHLQYRLHNHHLKNHQNDRSLQQAELQQPSPTLAQQTEEEEDENDNPPYQSHVRPLLHTSCLIGDEEAVVRLIATGAKVDEEDFAGCAPVQLASAAGHLNIVKLLLQNGAKPEKQDSSHGNTCLHEASWRGFSRLVKVLSNKLTVDKQNHGGFSPLHLACQAGHNQSAREILLAGGDPNLVNISCHNVTTRRWAVKCASLEAIYSYGDTALHTSVRYGHAGVARILLSARAAPDVQNKNGDCPLHIASAMGRKKLTKILLSSGCRLNLRNHQRETALDIAIRKGYDEICHLLQNPPKVITPIQRDEMRASKYNNSKSASSSGSKSKSEGKRRDLSSERERRSGGGSSGRSHPRREKSGGGSSSKHSSSKDSPSHSRSSNNDNNVLPNWSPYGCHYHPNPQAFPPPNIDSLPEEPLRSGELYYLDLAGNIHKGPIGISEGCYCTPILQPTSSVMESPVVQCAKNCQEQLRSLTTQLSKIHLDTQAQLSSLQSMLNEKLTQRESYQRNSCETQLKDWVKQYRRFRKELSKNPKALIQANELLERASTLMVTRPTSPCAEEEESDSDSGL